MPKRSFDKLRVTVTQIILVWWDHRVYTGDPIIECVASCLPSDGHLEAFLEISARGLEQLALEPVAL
ncbi:MAG: hypothetical protein CL700_13105 [Chloroflexi bacterium]|nr:hypothetical protein [Chloroflexota bacterium]